MGYCEYFNADLGKSFLLVLLCMVFCRLRAIWYYDKDFLAFVSKLGKQSKTISKYYEQRFPVGNLSIVEFAVMIMTGKRSTWRAGIWIMQRD